MHDKGPVRLSTLLSEYGRLIAATVSGATSTGRQSRSRGQKWLIFSTAAGSALAATASADASIIYSGIQDITATPNNPPVGHSSFFNATHHTSGTKNVPIGPANLALRVANGYARSVHFSQPFSFGGYGGLVQRGRTSRGGFAGLQARNSLQFDRTIIRDMGNNLPRGAYIGNSGFPFAGTNSAAMLKFKGVFGATTQAGFFFKRNYVTSGQFPSNGTGIAGFRFEAPDGTHYGWIRLDLQFSGSTVDSLTAVDWAYQSSPNVGIPAGDDGPPPAPTPEPNGLALLATGAVGVLALRRLRRNQPSPATQSNLQIGV